MRVVVDNPTNPSPDFRRAFEDSTTRLTECLALLDAIDAGHLLEEMPEGAAAVRHQCALSLISILDRELRTVVAQQMELLDPSGRR